MMPTFDRYERAWAVWLALVTKRASARKHRRTFGDQRRLDAARDLVFDLGEQILAERNRKR